MSAEIFYADTSNCAGGARSHKAGLWKYQGDGRM